MNIKIQQGGKTEEMHIQEGMSVLDILSELNLFPDAHIIMIEKTPVPIDYILKDGEVLKIVKVASGG